LPRSQLSVFSPICLINSKLYQHFYE
jgi:hypothetical protein